MSVLLDHDAASYLADIRSCESYTLYDRWISLWSAWSIRHQSNDLTPGSRRILYHIFLYHLVYVLERAGDEDVEG
jgi:hypothetical protein